MKALIAIDIQKGITDRKLYEKDAFFEAVNKAIDKYRKDGDSVIFIMHENKTLIAGSTQWQLDERLNVNEEDACFAKVKGNAFTSSELTKYLDEKGVKDILVCGLVSHGCVKATCEGGAALGYNMSLLLNGHTNYHAAAEEKILETQKYLTEKGIAIKKI